MSTMGRAVRRVARAAVPMSVVLAAVFVALPSAHADRRGVTPRIATASTLPSIVAHRGGTPGLAENTIPAFLAAIHNRADAIETDARFSADGVPVIIHDSTLDRTTSCRGAVTAQTVRQLRACGIPSLW